MTHEQFLEFIGGASPRLSYSSLKNLLVSPRRFYNYYTAKPETTRAMLLGNALHCAILRPQDFDNEYAVAPEIDRRTAAGKAAFAEFEASAAGKIVLTDKEYTDLITKQSHVNNCPDAVKILAQCEARETALEATLTHATLGSWLFKMILDASHQNKIIADLKSCADLNWFRSDAKKYHYDLQAALYKTLFPGCEFYFIAVDGDDCAVFEPSADFIVGGTAKLATCLTRLRELRFSGDWSAGLSHYTGVQQL